jgi:hypothetical protein
MHSRLHISSQIQESRPGLSSFENSSRGCQNPESLQSAQRLHTRNMSGGAAQSFPEKTRNFVLSDLNAELRGELQEGSTALGDAAPTSPESCAFSHEGHSQRHCALSHRDRESARPSHCRLTNRCSGRGHIKCSAAGGRVPSAHERCRARVLSGRWPAAELNR